MCFKEITINGTTVKMPQKYITAAYAGACAAHQVDVCEGLFGKDKVDFHEHFTGNMQIVKETCQSTVEGLPPGASLKEVVSSSPANYEYGGF